MPAGAGVDEGRNRNARMQEEDGIGACVVRVGGVWVEGSECVELDAVLLILMLMMVLPIGSGLSI